MFVRITATLETVAYVDRNNSFHGIKTVRFVFIPLNTELSGLYFIAFLSIDPPKYDT